MKEPEQNPYPLDEDAIQFIADIEASQRALTQQAQGVISYFVRKHGLKGEWRLAENRRELVFVPAPAQVPQQQE